MRKSILKQIRKHQATLDRTMDIIAPKTVSIGTGLPAEPADPWMGVFDAVEEEDFATM